GDTLYVFTDQDAPRRKVVAVDPRLRTARAGWKTIVPEAENPLEEAAAAGGKIFARYLVDVKSRIDVYSLDGGREGEVALPGPGAAAALTGREDGDELFYAYSSQLSPTTVYRYDLRTRTQAAFDPPPSRFDAAAYETTQVFYKSKDGTRVPMFLTARK